MTKPSINDTYTGTTPPGTFPRVQKEPFVDQAFTAPGFGSSSVESGTVTIDIAAGIFGFNVSGVPFNYLNNLIEGQLSSITVPASTTVVVPIAVTFASASGAASGAVNISWSGDLTLSNGLVGFGIVSPGNSARADITFGSQTFFYELEFV